MSLRINKHPLIASPASVRMLDAKVTVSGQEEEHSIREHASRRVCWQRVMLAALASELVQLFHSHSACVA